MPTLNTSQDAVLGRSDKSLNNLEKSPLSNSPCPNSPHYLRCLLWVSPLFYYCVWNRRFYFCGEHAKVTDIDGSEHWFSAIFDPLQCNPMEIHTVQWNLEEQRAWEGEKSDPPLLGKHVFHTSMNNLKSLYFVLATFSILCLHRRYHGLGVKKIQYSRVPLLGEFDHCYIRRSCHVHCYFKWSARILKFLFTFFYPLIGNTDISISILYLENFWM